ncbi:hypothetical protein L915_02761, partial [Phytophthora nicotianae]
QHLSFILTFTSKCQRPRCSFPPPSMKVFQLLVIAALAAATVHGQDSSRRFPRSNAGFVDSSGRDFRSTDRPSIRSASSLSRSFFDPSAQPRPSGSQPPPAPFRLRA